MAKLIFKAPLGRHIKPRFPHMNVTRVDETVSTDPLFSNCKSIYHGFTAAQIFFGTKSHTIFVYGIKSRAEFPNVYRDFIRAQGAPSALRRDNAREEQSELVTEINREFMIKDSHIIHNRIQLRQVPSDTLRVMFKSFLITQGLQILYGT